MGGVVPFACALCELDYAKRRVLAGGVEQQPGGPLSAARLAATPHYLLHRPADPRWPARLSSLIHLANRTRFQLLNSLNAFVFTYSSRLS